jgi:hypothetical protein
VSRFACGKSTAVNSTPDSIKPETKRTLRASRSSLAMISEAPSARRYQRTVPAEPELWSRRNCSLNPNLNEPVARLADLNGWLNASRVLADKRVGALRRAPVGFERSS